ncbi:GTP-binding protein [soil metagenome]
MPAPRPIPVIALTGYLGAGKTSLLNHVLRTSPARIGVVINDFGDVNVDATLVSGQIDEPASIAGGCICCLPDDGELDAALAKLADPRLELDAIIVEASGLADPVSIARIVGFSGVDGVRDGGVVDVVDAAMHFDTVDQETEPPARYGAATLVVVNKLDRTADPDTALERVKQRVQQRNPRAHVIGAISGQIDPALLYDVAAARDDSGQLSFRDMLFECATEDAHHHVHAQSVTVTSDGGIDADSLVDLLEDPPTGVYRMKGTVALRQRSSSRAYVVNVVGPSVHIARAANPTPSNTLVAIGTHFDSGDVRDRLMSALRPAAGPVAATALRRFQRYIGQR